jgi:tetratricopeptide (TPR) repeat protein
MIEESDEPGVRTQSGGEGVDPLATSLALGAAARDARVIKKAEDFLDEHTGLLRDQRERLRKEDTSFEEEQRLTLSHLRWRRFGDYTKASMEIAVGLLVLLVLAGFGAMAWQASTAHGLVVEPIHTPPDLSSRGLDGSTLAQHIIDRLNDFVAKSDVISYRAADNIAGDWGDDSKVEIPETGIAISELSRALRGWLGHETRLSGEVYREGSRLILRLRVDGSVPVSVTGAENDLDAMITKGAEAVFAQTQPFRYQMYLGQAGRIDEAIAHARSMALSGNNADRAWGYASWGNWLMSKGAYHETIARAHDALALDPENPQAESDLLVAEWALGRLEATLDAAKAAKRALVARSDVAPIMANEAPLSMQQAIEELTGAWMDSIGHDRIMTQYTIYEFNLTIPPLIPMDYAQIYDAKTARTVMKDLPQWNDKATTAQFAIMGPELSQFTTLVAANDWKGAAKDLADVDGYTLKLGIVDDVRHTLIWPWLAYAEARAGDLTAGRALVALTPLDCNLCLRMRGRLAELSGDRAVAASWYARADADAPSFAFALTDWSAMLLREGDARGAIAKLEMAHARVPHFADPLEMWGEALMLLNRSDLALAKFEEANKYAPNWGRLHLKWGEALFWSGDKAEATKQFAIASGLDLSAADRSELARARAHG